MIKCVKQTKTVTDCKKDWDHEHWVEIGGASVPVSRTAPIRVSMASHRRFEERPLKPMTAKFTHIGRGLFPLPRGCGDEVSRAKQRSKASQGEGQTGTSVFTVLTESRKQELTECKTNTKLALF